MKGFFNRRVVTGLVTIVICVVGVSLAYNANEGLPLVPSYRLKLEVPNAASLVRGNDVRMGGTRIGMVEKISPKQRPDGSVSAVLHVKLERSVNPLPKDSTVVVRPRSALGLKYVELSRGRSSEGLEPGATLPLANATPEPVEIDEVFDTFDEPTRAAVQANIKELGDALAGRGRDLNRAISELPETFDNLETAMGNIARERDGLKRFVGGLGATMQAVAPVADEQASLFVGLDRTFAAFAASAPYLSEAIDEAPETLTVATNEFRKQRPYLANLTGFSAELRPGIKALSISAPDLADVVDDGAKVLKDAKPFNRRLAKSFDNLREFNEEPLVPISIQGLSKTFKELDTTLSFITPAQTVCNYGTLMFRNASSLLSDGDAYGTWQRFISVFPGSGENNEGGPSSAPANGPKPENYLHVNPYPNTAAPGQPKECEAGNETYDTGKQVIGNDEGTQSDKTDVDAEAVAK